MGPQNTGLKPVKIAEKFLKIINITWNCIEVVYGGKRLVLTGARWERVELEPSVSVSARWKVARCRSPPPPLAGDQTLLIRFPNRVQGESGHETSSWPAFARALLHQGGPGEMGTSDGAFHPGVDQMCKHHRRRSPQTSRSFRLARVAHPQLWA